MTQREFLNAIINNEITEEIKGFAQASIEKLDNKNLARKSKPSKKKEENMELANSVALEGGTVYTTAMIAELMGVSSSKAVAIIKCMVEMEKLEEVEPVKVKGRTVKAYAAR